jgi:hypothetical protein
MDSEEIGWNIHAEQQRNRRNQEDRTCDILSTATQMKGFVVMAMSNK